MPDPHTPIITAAADGNGEFLRIIEAAGNAPLDLKKVDGVAYSGGSINQYWSRIPIVVDLDGMKFSAQIPLLYNHINDPDYRLGAITASVRDNQLHVDGGITATSDRAKNIIHQAKDFNWQLSIGAEAKRSELVEAGTKVTVNGREFTGPLNLVRESLLREVSVVAVGASEDTHLRIAAKFQFENNNSIQGGSKKMDPKTLAFIVAKFKLAADSSAETVRAHLDTIGLSENDIVAMMPKPAATSASDDVNSRIQAAGVVITPAAPAVPAAPTAQVGIAAAAQIPDFSNMITAALEKQREAESERVGRISSICAGEFVEIQAKAVSENWTPEQTSDEVLKAIRARRPTAEFNIITSQPLEGKERRGSIEAALCLRAGLEGEELVKAYGERAIEAAHKHRDISLKETMIQCCYLEGKTVSPSFDNDTIRAAFSTVSLPGILSNVANKKMLKSFGSQPITATKLCSEGDLNDFKESQRFRITDVGDIEPVGADGELKSSSLKEEKAVNQLDTFGNTFTLTRKMIINDDLGAFLKVPAAMGNRAARKIDQLFFTRLLANPTQADGQKLFSTKHNNIKTGSTSKLGLESLGALTKLFLDQTDADGQPISVEPRVLLVPTDLKIAAIELTKGAVLVVSGGTDASVRPAMNSLTDMNLQVISSPYLNNVHYANHSATGFYLFADPSQVDTFEIGYLKGKRTPTVETGAVDFNTLGISYRVYFDLGIREQDHRGMAFSAGA